MLIDVNAIASLHGVSGRMGSALFIGTLTQRRAVTLKTDFALNEVPVERVHHVSDFFTPVEVFPHNFMGVCVRLELLQDRLVLLRELGDEIFDALLFFVKVLLPLFGLRLQRLEVLRLAFQSRFFVGKLLNFNL